MRLAWLSAALLLAIGCGDSSDSDALADEGRLGGACKSDGTCSTAALRCGTGNVCAWAYLNAGNVGFEGGPCIDARSCTGTLECVGPVCGGPEAANGDVAVDLSGSAARLSWAPFRAVMVFVVRDSDPRTIVWGVRSEDGIDSPVTFASLPSGAEQLGTETSLERGTTYRAVVVRFDGSEAGAATLYDVFTP